MTQMESPKRKLQKKNDYQRHKFFRKIKRRRKAQAEADQQVAMKQLRKKLKLPKFDRGEDELSTYKKQVEMFNDANSDPTLPGRLVDRNRVTVNPETGDVIETGRHVNLDPVIITGKMPDNLKRTINKNIESNRLQDLLYKDRLSPIDPIGEFIVESAAIGKPLELAGKAALYGIGRYGGKLGLNKLQGLARQKLLEKEFSLQAGYPNEALFPTLMHDAGKLWAGGGHGPYGASIVKQIFPDATDDQIMAIYQHMDKVPESVMGKLVKGADIAEDNPFRNYNSGKDIHIKKSKRGTFTKAAKQHGMSVQSFANRVLRNPSKYSVAMRKKANFAHNAASWKH